MAQVAATFRRQAAQQEKPLQELTLGRDVVGRGVFLGDGAMLAPGQLLDLSLVEQLVRAGHSTVRVLTGDGIRPESGSAERTAARAELLAAVLRSYIATPARAVARDPAAGRRAESALDVAVRTAAWFKPVADVLTTRALRPDYLGPAMQCTVYATVTGAQLGMDDDALFDLALGAMFADVGMLMVPGEIAAKQGFYTPLERRIMQRHVELGAELVQPLAAFAPAVPEIVAQHHERADGRGYPAGQSAAYTQPGAQVIAVVQRYLAAVAARPMRPAMPPHEGLELLMSLAGHLAPLPVIEAFVEGVLVYALGATVRLGDDTGGVVVAPGAPGRPVVERRYDASGKRIERERVDLGIARSLFITATGPVLGDASVA